MLAIICSATRTTRPNITTKTTKYVKIIDSVLRQTMKEIEIVCVDDGSTDGSFEVIKKKQAEDKRIRIVTENNAGPSVARNKGLARARGEYVIFLDADDMYEPTLLESLYNMAEADNLDVAVTRFDIYNEFNDTYVRQADEPHASIFAPGKVTSKNEYPDFIFASTTGYVWNKLIRTSFLRDKKIAFDNDLYVFEDVHFVCSVMALAERVERIEDILIHHRVYSEQSRATLFRKYYGQVPVVYQKIRDFLKRQGMYIPLKKGFFNFSTDRCFKIYNILWADGKERLWNMLHDQYIVELEWLSFDKSEFESPEICEFVANAALYTYAEYISRSEKGESLDVEGLEDGEIVKKVNKNQKISKRRAIMNKILQFINIFKKKNK